MHLDFEKPVLELEGKIKELNSLTGETPANLEHELKRLHVKTERLLKQAYARLTPAQKVLVARHPERPHSHDYIQHLFQDFTPLSGDRLFAEDLALVAGLARFRGMACVVMGHEKGHDTESRLKHNFGMVKPEGYRKAQRLMELAHRFHLPVISFIDTAGAFPGVSAEERGQAEAIARSIEVCLTLESPLLSVVVGEGGSGGAIAIAAADYVMMLEHAIYSVISPEGCASILWRSASPEHTKEAAQSLRLTAEDLKSFGIIDEVIAEPYGGAHRFRIETMDKVGNAIEAQLHKLSHFEGKDLLARRREKFLAMGV
ncbi:MAG: acetyl-CoA carboxylase carboxyltransferase subunit alpha [Alphaproteobacteria bacterium]